MDTNTKHNLEKPTEVEQQASVNQHVNQPPKPNQDYGDELKEGALYVFQDGDFVEIQRDPEDTLKKVRLLDDAISAATHLQKHMRKALGGYKPDLTTVCSALIIAKAKEDDASKAVVDLFAEMTARMDSAVR